MSADNNDRFFARLHHLEHRGRVKYGAGPLVADKVRQLIQNACKVNDIIGIGENGGVVPCSVCGTVLMLLVEAGTPNFAIMMSTDHYRCERLKITKPFEALSAKKIVFALGPLRKISGAAVF